tara:strand:+ start:2148 stop:2564 length:417 start_codon:yes stop_codon:yes gene_type:complete
MKIPNKTTKDTFEKTDRGGDIKEWSSVNDFFKSLKDEVDKVEDLYDFVDKDKVLLFIAERIFLTDILLETYPYIQKYFPNHIAILEFDDEEDNKLWIRIKTDLDADKAGDSLNKLDKNWWLDTMPKSEYRLNITIDFV